MQSSDVLSWRAAGPSSQRASEARDRGSAGSSSQYSSHDRNWRSAGSPSQHSSALPSPPLSRTPSPATPLRPGQIVRLPKRIPEWSTCGRFFKGREKECGVFSGHPLLIIDIRDGLVRGLQVTSLHVDPERTKQQRRNFIGENGTIWGRMIPDRYGRVTEGSRTWSKRYVAIAHHRASPPGHPIYGQSELELAGKQELDMRSYANLERPLVIEADLLLPFRGGTHEYDPRVAERSMPWLYEVLDRYPQPKGSVQPWPVRTPSSSPSWPPTPTSSSSAAAASSAALRSYPSDLSLTAGPTAGPSSEQARASLSAAAPVFTPAGTATEPTKVPVSSSPQPAADKQAGNENERPWSKPRGKPARGQRRKQ